MSYTFINGFNDIIENRANVRAAHPFDMNVCYSVVSMNNQKKTCIYFQLNCIKNVVRLIYFNRIAPSASFSFFFLLS